MTEWKRPKTIRTLSTPDGRDSPIAEQHKAILRAMNGEGSEEDEKALAEWRKFNQPEKDQEQ